MLGSTGPLRDIEMVEEGAGSHRRKRVSTVNIGLSAFNEPFLTCEFPTTVSPLQTLDAQMRHS
jgi:hypothetical protein